MKERIELTDSLMDMIIKMSEGNPGAVAALTELYTNYAEINPESAFGGFSPILSFDSCGIYGAEIYIIWNDKCQRDTRKVATLLRAVQLGILPEAKLKALAKDQTRQVNLTKKEWEEIDTKVCKQLKRF